MFVNEQELISVVMPAYNAANYIAASIETVLQQTHTCWELIIIDDGSTDATTTIIKNYAYDKRIKYIYQQNSKQGKARNIGMAHAKGNFVAFLDADDLWMKDKLEKQLTFLNQTKADLVFSDVVLINALGEQQKDSWGVNAHQYKGNDGILAFVQQNRIPLLSVLAKKEMLVKINGFSENLAMQYVEDYDLWLRMLQAGAVFAASAEKLAAYRLQDNLSRERRTTILKVADILRTVRIKEKSLISKKNMALKLWIRRFVKTCLPHITSDELNKIILLFPLAAERFFFSAFRRIFGNSVTANVILVYLKNKANKEFKMRNKVSG